MTEEASVGKLGSGFRRMLTAPVRALLPRNRLLRWLVILLPVLLLLAFLGPAVDLIIKLLELGMRVIEPLLQTTIGRVLLLLTVIGLGSLTAATLLRSRLRDFRHRVLLGRHVAGVTALLSSDRRRCRDQFARVARNKVARPSDYPHVVQDAGIKLARLSLEDGDIDGALGWLTRVVEPGLPPELQRSLLQLRVQALRRQGAALPETLEEEVREGIKRFPDDFVLHKELRTLVLQRGERVEAADLQTRIARLAPPDQAGSERETLLADLTLAGRECLERGDLEAAKKLQKRLHKLGGPAAGLLLGEIHAHAGDVRAAVRAFGQTRSPEGLDRIAELLARHPGVMEPREIIECCPMQGTLLLLARELARQGELEQARRAAVQAAESLGPTPTVCAVLAEVLHLLGREQEARLLGEQAVQRLLSSG